MKVIPSVNFFEENTFKEIIPKLELLKKEGAQVVHIDVSDGKFTKALTPFTADFFNSALGSLFKFEVHLMVENPVAYMKTWVNFDNVERFIIHIESDFNVDEAREFCLKNGKELEFAVGLEGEVEDLIDLSEMAKLTKVLFLAVPPGFSGQEFDDSVLEKIRLLKSAYPSVEVFVDGGVNEEVVNRLKDAGTTGVITGSYLWKSDDVRAAYDKLVNV